MAAKEMNHSWYPIWAFALLTGMRNGEMFALTWDDIDFENQIINLTKSFNKRTRETKCTKGGYWRHIPISSELNALLRVLNSNQMATAMFYHVSLHGEWGIKPKNFEFFAKALGFRV